MTGSQKFLRRWSRLKRAERQRPPQSPGTPPAREPACPPAVATSERGQPPQSGPEPSSLAETALPAIQSIAANTDIRAFLRAGVPAELTKAALRRAWTTDPAIRDFIGIAENQWDFTDPTAMPGFGPLEATDDVQKLVAQAMGRLGETAQQLAGTAETGERAADSGLQCTKPAPGSVAPTQAPQTAGIPRENPECPELADAPKEHPPVNAAARNEPEPAENGPAPNRRGHGSALPQ